MPKSILIVDSDAGLRTQLSEALAAHGFEVHENPDGRDALEQIRTNQPAAVVLCVELPKGSGYVICSKLRKDDNLKKIPVILTSAEATEQAFEGHKKLKMGRADEYLLKPFEPDELVEKIMALVGSSGAEPDKGDALGLSDLAAEFGDSPSESSAAEDSISFEEVEEIAVDEDIAPSPSSLPGARDVELLETAFENLETPEDSAPLANGHADVTGEAAILDSSAEADEPDEVVESDESSESDGDYSDQTQVIATLPDPPVHPETRAVASAAAAVVAPPPLPASIDSPPRSTSFVGSRDKDYFQLKEKLAQREKDMLRLREELTASEKELIQQRDRELEIEQEVAARDEEILKRDQQIKQLQQKTEAFVAGQKRLERDLAAARDEAKTATARADSAEKQKNESASQAAASKERADGLESELTAANQKVDELTSETEQQRAQSDELGAELTGVRAQLDEANGEISELRERIEANQQSAQSVHEQLTSRISDLELEKQKHEDRVVKTFQRLKGEEQLREKAKKALGIALQLLDEPGEELESAQALEDDQLS